MSFSQYICRFCRRALQQMIDIAHSRRLLQLQTVAFDPTELSLAT